MALGVSGYFLERARAARRVALLTLGISLVALAGLGLALTPAIRNSVNRITHASRFGYEGPDQYVQRISLRQFEGVGPTARSDLGSVSTRVERAGGGSKASKEKRGRPVPRAVVVGPGTSDRDIALRSIGRLGGVPIVRSEELVIDRLVRPEYPTPLLEKNIEGKVILQALIDTVGQVVEVQMMGSTGELLFERAAEDAVWQCRFRPYRPGGRPASEVYAVFRFAFRIY